MTMAPVGSGFDGGSSSFSLTPNGVGNFILVEVISRSAAEYATALSSSNVTWSVLVAATAIPSQATYATVFIGEVTSTSTATVTVSFNSGTPTIRLSGMEFSTTLGYAAVHLDSYTLTPAGGTTTDYPTITPAFGAGELYYAFAYNAGSASAGSTSGYTYYVDSNTNGACWNAACANSAQTPVWADNNGRGGMAVMLYEAITLVQNVNFNGAQGAAAQTVSIVSSSGSTLIVTGCTLFNTLTGVTDSAGNTWHYSTSAAQNPPWQFFGTDVATFVAWCISANPVTSVTITCNGASAYSSLSVSEWAGIGSEDTGVGNAVTSAANGNPVSPTITLAGTGELIVGAANADGNGIGTVPSGTTTLDSVGANLAYALSQSGSVQWTWGGRSPAQGTATALAAFLPVSGGGGSFTGTGSARAKKPVASGSGSFNSTVGTGSATAKKPVASGSGAETFTGSAAVSAKKAVSSGTGVEPFTGVGAILAKKPVAIGTAAFAITGTGAITAKKAVTFGFTPAFGSVAVGQGSIADVTVGGRNI